jgi:hypothetical protein
MQRGQPSGDAPASRVEEFVRPARVNDIFFSDSTSIVAAASRLAVIEKINVWQRSSVANTTWFNPAPL